MVYSPSAFLPTTIMLWPLWPQPRPSLLKLLQAVEQAHTRMVAPGTVCWMKARTCAAVVVRWESFRLASRLLPVASVPRKVSVKLTPQTALYSAWHHFQQLPLLAEPIWLAVKDWPFIVYALSLLMVVASRMRSSP